MKSVGFIDYYLDEWHAQTYPGWIREHSAGRFEVKYAFGEIDSPKPGGAANREWAKKYGVTLCGTIEEVVEKSDVLAVLSPDNAERHEDLSRLALMSGKNVYIDKTFANDKACAKRMFDLSYAYGTPCYSSSALRFADEYGKVNTESLTALSSWGPGDYDNYSVHQLEPIVALMGVKAKRVMRVGSDSFTGLVMEFEGGRTASIAHFPASPFMMQLCHGGLTSEIIRVESDFFANFIKDMIRFFETGKILVPHEETMAIMAIREAGFKAALAPYQWVLV